MFSKALLGTVASTASYSGILMAVGCSAHQRIMRCHLFLQDVVAVNTFAAGPSKAVCSQTARYHPNPSANTPHSVLLSLFCRLFKLPGQLEALPEEDYGQTATYNGSLPGCEAAYVLDNAHSFPTGGWWPAGRNPYALHSCAPSALKLLQLKH
jgi:hypothetical protein